MTRHINLEIGTEMDIGNWLQPEFNFEVFFMLLVNFIHARVEYFLLIFIKRFFEFYVIEKIEIVPDVIF